MSKSNGEKISVFQLIIIVLSVYVLGSLLVTAFFALPSELMVLLSYIDTAICIVFLVDFVIRFVRAPNKLHFMKWGWIDLISSIPTLEYARAGRALRLIRLLRVLRAFRSTRILVKHLYARKAQGAIASALIIAILMLLFSSIAILQVETAENSNITTAEDALWWAFVTITTVGYGDKFPVTTEGRIIAMFLMTTGVGLFGIFTAYVASLFVEDKSNTTTRTQ